ncbi:MAG: hypothetical protein R2850_09825 [Bacteroidia bacterium]
MRLVFLFILIYFCVPVSLAQNFKQGQSYEAQKGFHPLNIPGIIGEELLLLRISNDSKTGFEKSFILDRFDTSSLNFKGSWSPELPLSGMKAPVREACLIWNNKLCVFYSDFLKEKRQYRLVYYVIDAEGNAGSERELLQLPAAGFNIGSPRFDLSISENGKWLSVFYHSLPARNANTEISVARFDSLYQQTGLTQAQIGFEPGNLRVEQSITDNDGNLHVLLSNEKDSLQRFSLFAFPVFGNEILEYPLEIPGKEIETVRIALGKIDKLFVAGFFRESFGEKSKSAGVFFILTDRESGRVDASSIKLFQTDLKALNAGDIELNKENLRNLKSFGLFPGPDNRALLIADSRSLSIKCEIDYRNGLEVCHDLFASGNLICVSFDARGEPAWYRLIDNAQESVDDGGRYLGFASYEGKSGSVRLLRNVQPPANHKLKEDSYRRAVPVNGILNSNGQFEESNANFELPFPAYTGIVFKEKSGKVYFLSGFSDSFQLNLIRN